MSDKSASNKPAPDWERIEADYRAGILSLREIAEPFSITHTAIRKRAEREGWTRDLTAKIRAKAEALVSKDAVSSEVSKADKVSEREIVDANAELLAAVDRRHKGTAKKGQELVEALLAEVAATTEHIEVFLELGELMDKTRETDGGKVIEDKLNKAYHAAISMPGRVDSLKKLADTFEKFFKVERIAYRLDDSEPPPDPGSDLTPERQSEGIRRLAFLLTQAARQQPEPAHG